MLDRPVPVAYDAPPQQSTRFDQARKTLTPAMADFAGADLRLSWSGSERRLVEILQSAARGTPFALATLRRGDLLVWSSATLGVALSAGSAHAVYSARFDVAHEARHTAEAMLLTLLGAVEAQMPWEHVIKRRAEAADAQSPEDSSVWSGDWSMRPATDPLGGAVG